MTAIWNDVSNHAKSNDSVENKHRWQIVVILERRGKISATISLRGIANVNTKSVNYCKAQHERKCGKIRSAKDIKK